VVDLVHERDTQGALLFVERLSQGATDYTQFIKDLLGHLRDVYVVKHTGEVPSSIAMTEDHQQVLRSQASRVSTVETVAFIDLLGEAMRSVRQGSDARLELELVLIKMTAAHALQAPGGVARWADAPTGHSAPSARPQPAAPAQQAAAKPSGATRPTAPPAPRQAAETAPEVPGAQEVREAQAAPRAAADQGDERLAPRVATPAEPAAAQAPAPAEGSTGMTADIDHFRRGWPLVIEAVKRRQVGLAAVLAEGRPESVDGDTLVVKFPAGNRFQYDMVTRGENPQVIAEALREITDKPLKIVARLAVQEPAELEPQEEDARILSKDQLLLRLKQEFDASVIDDGPSR
jgi:DNA polymerase-3 subunit gamma/tau